MRSLALLPSWLLIKAFLSACDKHSMKGVTFQQYREGATDLAMSFSIAFWGALVVNVVLVFVKAVTWSDS